MKKNVLAFINIVSLLSIFTFICCEKEKEDPGKLLVGNWNQVSSKSVLYYDNVKTSETNSTFELGEYILKIYENGTASRFNNGTLTSSYYWTIEGDILLLTWDTGSVQKTGYTVDGTTLILQWAVEEAIDGHITRSDYEGVYKRD